jgi:NAD(P)-dependent dehydrogenase (short-subunit alcohol dehydrogenase family)
MASLNIDTSIFHGLRGKVAFISGGSSGIGLETAILFASNGAKVVICDVQEPLKTVPGSVFSKCDVAVWADLLAAFDNAVNTFGAVDILVANAGVGERQDYFLDELDNEGKLMEPSYTIIDVNLKGVLNSVKIAMSHFRSRNSGGRIVMVTSTAGYMSEMHLPVYSATKHAVSLLLHSYFTSLTSSACRTDESIEIDDGEIQYINQLCCPVDDGDESFTTWTSRSTRNCSCAYSKG